MERRVCNNPSGVSPATSTTPCCSDLIDDDGVCKDPSLHDPSLKRCDPFDPPTTACGAGEACLPGTSENLFTGSSDESEMNRHYVEDELNTALLILGGEGPRANLQSCKFHRECASRFCDSSARSRSATAFTSDGVCREQKICRRAHEGEDPGAGTCEVGLRVVGGVCATDPTSRYNDLDDAAVYRLVSVEFSEAEQCRFELPAEVQERSKKALMFLRSMEYLFSSSSIPDSDDCLQLLPYMKALGAQLNQGRAAALKQLSERTEQIERDFENILEAQQHRQNQTPNLELIVTNSRGEPLTVHGEPVNMRKLADRIASGYDMLRILKRRNEAWLDYENELARLLQEVNAKVRAVEEPMGVTSDNTWGNDSTRWNLAGTVVDGGDLNCRTTGIARFFSSNKKVKSRWRQQYKVSAESQNTSIVRRPLIERTLAAINGTYLEGTTSYSAIRSLFNARHWLHDPLMPGYTNRFRDWGTLNAWERLWNGGNKKRRLTGEDGHTYQRLRSAFKTGLVEYYSRLRPADYPNLPGFVYEPELVNIKARNCIDVPTGEDCQAFNQLLEDLTDVTFAQFWAYSYHSNDSYLNLHNVGDSWRRNLFSHYVVQSSNIGLYYNALSTHRLDQNTCLQRLIDRIEQNEQDDAEVVPVTEGPGTPQGGGAKNYFENTDYQVNNPREGAQAQGPGASRGTLINAPRFSGTFRANSVNTGTNLVPTSSLSTQSSDAHLRAQIEARAANLAARIKSLQAANARARARGINVQDGAKTSSTKLPVEKKSADSAGINTFSQTSAGPTQAGASAGGSGPSSGSNAEEKKEDLSTGRAITLGQGASASGSQSRSQSESGTFAGIDSGNDGSSKYVDPTGMSNEEKDVLMANFERNRSSFNPGDDDSLFEVISKTYVRNLEKILTRKRAE